MIQVNKVENLPLQGSFVAAELIDVEWNGKLIRFLNRGMFSHSSIDIYIRIALHFLSFLSIFVKQPVIRVFRVEQAHGLN